VIGFSVFVGFIGGVVGILLGGSLIVAVMAGVCAGFSFSINQNFDVKSFFATDKAHKLFRIFTWLLLLGGLGYFVWLVMSVIV